MQNSLPALALRQLFEPELPVLPLKAISCPPCCPPTRRTISRHSPCGNSSSLNSPFPRSKQCLGASPPAEQSPGARPAASRRARNPIAPAQNNIKPPPISPYAEQSPGARPAAALRAQNPKTPERRNDVVDSFVFFVLTYVFLTPANTISLIRSMLPPLHQHTFFLILLLSKRMQCPIRL